MDDMTAFERQVARRFQHHAGPVRPVNAAAIFTAITATQSPKWRFQSMFSATKFVVAGAIVALFGGFVLSGVLTQRSDEPLPPAAASTSASPEANATWTPPPELVMEEVAPGVTQATLAGVSGFKAASGPHDFAFDAHGDLWLLSPAGLLRVGDDTAFPSPALGGFPDLSLAPDGAMWALANGTVASFRDGAWTEAPPFPGDTEDGPGALEVLPDGTVWAGSTTTLARLDGDAWTAYPIPDGHGVGFPGDLAWTPDGSLWVTTCKKKETGSLLRFDGEVLRPVEHAVPVEGCIGPLVSGLDGELWAYIDADRPTLALFDGTDWALSSDGAGIPRIQWMTGICEGRMVAAPDGRMWAIGRRGDSHQCAGDVLGAYDGVSWTDALRSDWRLTEDAPLRVGPDGHLWVEPVSGLFLVVTPEALAAAEPEAVEPDEQAESTEQATTTDLLPGVDLVTEEFEPGVYRVEGDGIRDLSLTGLSRQRDLTITPDGSVWVSTSAPSAAFQDHTLWEEPTRIRLGDPTPYDPEAYRAAVGDTPAGVRPYTPWHIDAEGTVWASGAGASVLQRGESGWTEHPIDLDAVGIEPRSAEAVQAAVEKLRAERARAGLDPDVTILVDDARPEVTGLKVDANGDVWVALSVPSQPAKVLLRFDGQTWSAVDPVGVGPYSDVVLSDPGPDGSLWVYLQPGSEEPQEPYLARLADGRWTVFGREDGVVPLGYGETAHLLRVGHDGRVWVRPEAGGASGVRTFDGTTWRRYLEGHQVNDLEIGPDGEVWVLTKDGRSYQDPEAQHDLYVITPEAVAE